MPWPVPEELDQPLPRRVVVDPVPRVMLIVGLSTFWLVVTLFLFVSFVQCHGMARLKATGVDTVGVIKTAETIMASRGGERRYDVEYVFVPQTQTSRLRSYTGKAFPSAAAFSDMAVGNTVVVTYDPHSPSASQLRSELDTTWAEPYAKFLELAEFLMPLISIVSALAIGHARWSFLREEHLVRWGNVAPAVIVGERQVYMSKQHRTRLTYQFQDDDGRIVTGKRSDLTSRKALNVGYGAAARPTVADNPVVLYDPANSSRNLLFPPVMMRLVR